MPALKMATSATDSACRASRCQSVSALSVCVCALEWVRLFVPCCVCVTVRAKVLQVGRSR